MEDLTVNLREIKATLAEVAIDASGYWTDTERRVFLGRKANETINHLFAIPYSLGDAEGLIGAARFAAHRLGDKLAVLSSHEQSSHAIMIGRLASALPAVEPAAGSGAPGRDEGGEGGVPAGGQAAQQEGLLAAGTRIEAGDPVYLCGGKLYPCGFTPPPWMTTPQAEWEAPAKPEDTIEVEMPSAEVADDDEDLPPVVDMLIDRLVDERAAKLDAQAERADALNDLAEARETVGHLERVNAQLIEGYSKTLAERDRLRDQLAEKDKTIAGMLAELKRIQKGENDVYDWPFFLANFIRRYSE